MKLWFTRPEIQTCISRGLRDCEVWVKKPFFDTTPRGPAAGRLFEKFPVGWRVVDDDGLDAAVSLALQVGNRLAGHDDVQWALWDAMCISICGRVDRENWAEVWEAAAHRYVDDENFVDGCESFLFECDVTPALWFRIALGIGDNEIRRSYDFRERVWYGTQEALAFDSEEQS